MIRLGIRASTLVLLLLIARWAHAAPMVLYTFEGDSGQSITDKLTADGAQDATNVIGNVIVDTNPAHAAFGSNSGYFPYLPTNQQNTLDIPGTQNLGTTFTLAAMVNESQGNWSRLFSAYHGGSATADQLIFDFDPSQAIGFGLRAVINGQATTRSVPGGFNDGAYHHLAATYNNGRVRLYLDGVQLGAEASVPAGPVSLLYDLRLGEDYPPTSRINERLEGHVDDVLVHPHPLSPSQVQALATHGANGFFSAPMGIYYSAEGDSAFAGDKLITDGAQNGTFSNAQVTIDNARANARFGQSSIAFGTDASALNTVSIADSTALGEQFTLSAFVRYDGNAATLTQARLFTNYRGSGAALPGELLFDFNPAGGPPGINGMRFLINTGDGVESVIPAVPVTFNDGRYHHLAATYDNGQVSTYLDGVLIAKGTAGSGFANLVRNLQLGEDAGGAPGVQEQFIGRMDDMLVLQGRALSKSEMMTLAVRGVEGAVANPNPFVAGVLYTGDGPHPPGGVADRLAWDGRQDGIFHGNVSIDANPANARFGDHSLLFGSGLANTIELSDTRQLGDAFTLAAFIKSPNTGVTRLFSSYSGGPVGPGEFLFDFDPSGISPWLNGLRVVVNGVQLKPDTPLTFATDEYRHLAMTYDDGLVRAFLDGDELFSGLAGSGPVNLFGNMRFGEDIVFGANEQFYGNADQILFVREALSRDQIALLSQNPVLSVIPEPSAFMLMILGGLGVLLAGFRRRRIHGEQSPISMRSLAMRNPFIVLLTVCCLLLLVTSAAHAVLITSGAGKVLLDDNFELPLPGSPPNNGIFPGTWSWSVGAGLSAVEVTDAPMPGPVYGNQYLRMARTNPGGADLRGQFAQTISSGTLHTEFMANVTNTSEAAFGISQTTSGFSSAQVWIMPWSDGTIRHYSGGAWQNTGLNYSPGNWQLWKIDADMDAKQYTLSVGKQTPVSLPFKDGAPATAGYFITRVNQTPAVGQIKEYYIDQAVYGPFNEWHAANGAMPNVSPGFGMRNPEYISLEDGVMAINDTGSGYPQVLNVEPWPSLAPKFPNDTFSETEEYMVDFNMRIVSLSANAWAGTHRLIADDGTRRVNVSWIKNASDEYMVALYKEGSGAGNLAVSDPLAFDPRQFHDYRLEKRLTDRTPGSAKGIINLYADSQLLLSAPYESFGGTSSNYLAIGTGSSTGDGHSEWKSFRYNSRDNFLPDPEPAVVYKASTADPVLPDALAKDPWLHQVRNNAPSPSYVDGALRLEVEDTYGQYNRYYREEPGILLPDGTANNLVAEWSMRISRFDATSGARVVIDEGTGGRRVQAVVTDTSIGLVPEGHGGGSALWTTALDPTEWHNYRLIKNVGADTVDLFVGDMSMPLLSLDYSRYGFTGSPTPEIGFGWTYSAANGAADFGYFRYRLGTTLIPEPSSFGLLLCVGLAGLTVFGRRRRQGRESRLQVAA